jgi:L-aspartate oxidase
VQRFLLSEALRGEGALLRNHKGERFMDRYHPLAELAPRDIVARAITQEGLGNRPGEVLPVYLDMRHVTGMDLDQRFPGISAFLREQGLELSRDLIPIRPAAHYLMGGVRTDLKGRTSLPGLYAAGEVACTGVHGANRLASNSLLEGVVFGARAGAAMLEETQEIAQLGAAPQRKQEKEKAEQIPSLRELLRDAMWLHAGLLRDENGLRTVQSTLAAMEGQLPQLDTREAIELRNLHTIATLIVRSALARKESRGAHARTDFPGKQTGEALHSSVQRDQVRFVPFTS